MPQRKKLVAGEAADNNKDTEIKTTEIKA